MAEKTKYDYTKRSVGEKVAIMAKIDYSLRTVIGTLVEFSDSVVRIKTPTCEVKLQRKELSWILPDDCFDANGNLTKTGQILTMQRPIITGEELNEKLKSWHEKEEQRLKAERERPSLCEVMASAIKPGNYASFTLNSGKTIAGKVFNATRNGSWFNVLTDYGTWRVIKGTDIKSIAAVV